MDTRMVVAFWGIDLLLALTPGADWMYVMTAEVREKAALPAVTGLVTGYAVHTVIAITGLAVLIATIPSALTALTIAGAAYLFWLGATQLVRPATGATHSTSVDPSARRVLLRGAGISGLNPKGLLLYLALIPQFVSPGRSWRVAAQVGLLGVLHMGNCAVVYLGVALLARVLLRARPAATRTVTRAAGAVMIGIGALLLLERLAL